MSQELRNLARRIAEKRGLDPELFVRLIQTESNFNPNARGAAGEIGLGQILPITNADPGFGVRSANDLLNPTDNLVFAADYLKKMIDRYGNVSKGVAAYNTGAGNVDKGVIPKSTQQYVSKIVGSDVPSSSKDSVVPASRTSDGVDSEMYRSLMRQIDAMFPEMSSKKIGLPRIRTERVRRSSPLSKIGIPGMGSIAKYSAPGGVASLIKKKKQTSIT